MLFAGEWMEWGFIIVSEISSPTKRSITYISLFVKAREKQKQGHENRG
jgi:hypothetical protein